MKLNHVIEANLAVLRGGHRAIDKQELDDSGETNSNFMKED